MASFRETYNWRNVIQELQPQFEINEKNAISKLRTHNINGTNKIKLRIVVISCVLTYKEAEKAFFFLIGRTGDTKCLD